MKTIHIYADYVCPFCLLAEPIVREATAGRDVALSWWGHELRPDPVPTLRPEDPYLPAIWKDAVYPMAERLGLSIRLPTISPQPRTARAFELLELARDEGLDAAFSIRVLRAFFEEDRDIGATETLVALAGDVGLDPQAARRALETGACVGRYQEAARHAREDLFISAVPTIVVGGEVIRGVPSPDHLKHAIDEFLQGPVSASTHA